MPGAAAAYDWSVPRSWSFEPLDSEAFGAVELARRAGKAAGTAPAAYNAANEVCVDAFCAGRIGFLGIVDTVGAVLVEHLAGDHVADADLTVRVALDPLEESPQFPHLVVGEERGGDPADPLEAVALVGVEGCGRERAGRR